jgi:hypothetical protein
MNDHLTTTSRHTLRHTLDDSFNIINYQRLPGHSVNGHRICRHYGSADAEKAPRQSTTGLEHLH